MASLLPLWADTIFRPAVLPSRRADLPADMGADGVRRGPLSETRARRQIARDVVEVYRAWMHPVVLDGGKRLFDADGACLYLQPPMPT
jgi:hypothetical protein